jgi:3,4-dihydroxy 2-butanone 4-phosphate synthase/GTP cyclohydrolase II
MKNLLSQFASGQFIIVMDEHREKEADFFLLAEYATPEKINFLLKNAKGLLCVSCAPEILDRLHIPLMVEKPADEFSTNFCLSVDAAEGITTGISASDRCRTIQLLADPNSKPKDFVIPGHSFPLRARNPKDRWGHTECSVELAKKCGKIPVVVICEILNEAGEKANTDEVMALAEKYNIAFQTL